MSILIKGVKMPKTCEGCNLESFCDLWVEARRMSNGNRAELRHPECPLIPVPPHGLIDRERMLESIRLELAQADAVNDMEDYDSWVRVFDYVRKFPTIIPASEEGER